MMVQMKAKAKSGFGPASAVAAVVVFVGLALCLVVQQTSPGSSSPDLKGLRLAPSGSRPDPGGVAEVDQESEGGEGGGVSLDSAATILEADLPHLIYGTAWKKSATADLVSEAVSSGFRFIDTACQPKHYDEALVGRGWRSAADRLGLSRQDIFLQTKFTAVGGQDPEDVPYDVGAPLEEQVRQSVRASLRNLQVSNRGRRPLKQCTAPPPPSISQRRIGKNSPVRRTTSTLSCCTVR